MGNKSVGNKGSFGTSEFKEIENLDGSKSIIKVKISKEERQKKKIQDRYRKYRGL